MGHGTRKTRKTRKTSQPKFISLQFQPSPSSSTLTLGSPSAAQPSTPPRHAPHPPDPTPRRPPPDQTPAPAPAVQAPNPRRRPAKPLLPVAATRQPPSPRLQERVRARRIRLLHAPGSCSPIDGGGSRQVARSSSPRPPAPDLPPSRPRLQLQAPAVHWRRRRVGPRAFGGGGGSRVRARLLRHASREHLAARHAYSAARWEPRAAGAGSRSAATHAQRDGVKLERWRIARGGSGSGCSGRPEPEPEFSGSSFL